MDDIQQLCARAAAQQLRQRAHENVKAAIGFEIPRHIGDDLVAMRQCTPKTRHAEGRGTLRARDIGIHAFVQHADPRAHLGRIQAALPLGRGVTPVGGLEREQIGGVARAGAPDR